MKPGGRRRSPWERIFGGGTHEIWNRVPALSDPSREEIRFDRGSLAAGVSRRMPARRQGGSG